MSKRIVFLYCTKKNKDDIALYERVVRALMRKYRRSPLFSYLEIDTSPSCRDAVCSLIHTETSRRGAIFLESDVQNTPLCMDLLKSVFGIFASSHHISGRAICCPEHEEVMKNGEDSVIYTKVCKKENIKKAAELSLAMAKRRKHSLSLCLVPTNETDSVFLHESEIVLGGEKHIPFELISLDEMISLCVKTVPSFDVVLTTKEYASLIAMHLNSMPDIPSGFTVSYGEKNRIYKRQILPYEEIGNLHYLSSLLSIAAIFENELDMKSAADWLRKALSITFAKESGSTPEVFIESVIKELEKPIRKRRTKQYEN